jgi:hypothetical protein
MDWNFSILVQCRELIIFLVGILVEGRVIIKVEMAARKFVDKIFQKNKIISFGEKINISVVLEVLNKTCVNSMMTRSRKKFDQSFYLFYTLNRKNE